MMVFGVLMGPLFVKATDSTVCSSRLGCLRCAIRVYLERVIANHATEYSCSLGVDVDSKDKACKERPSWKILVRAGIQNIRRKT